MLYYIYGPDSYLVRRTAEEHRERFSIKHAGGIQVFVFDCSDRMDPDALEASFKNTSLFQPAKFIWLKNPYSQKNASSAVESLLEKYAPGRDADCDVVLSEITDKKPARKSGSGSVEYVPRLTGSKLEQWIKEGFLARDRTIQPAAIKQLVRNAGADGWTLSGEMDKLANFAGQSPITAQDIDLLVPDRQELNIFELTDALGARNKARALDLLYRELNTGRDPYYVLTMIIYQFRNLLMVKDISERSGSKSAIAQKTGLHPYVAQKLASSAAKSGLNELKEAYSRLALLETGTKQGLFNLTDSLYSFVLSS